MKKLLPILFFLISPFLFSQNKDTIYVYEEVIEYDTVWVKKPDVVVNPRDERAGRRKRRFPKKTDFSFSILGGNKQLSIQNNDEKISQNGAGIGLFLRRTAFFPEMSLSLGVQFFKWPESARTNSIAAFQNYDGISVPNLSKGPEMKYFSNEHNEIILPINFYYTWKNFSPYLGFFLNYTNYKVLYEFVPRAEPSQFHYFSANQYNFGYTMGVLYQTDRLGISLEYQQHEYLRMNLWNREAGNINLKFKNGFQDHKILLGLHLSLVQ